MGPRLQEAQTPEEEAEAPLWYQQRPININLFHEALFRLSPELSFLSVFFWQKRI